MIKRTRFKLRKKLSSSLNHETSLHNNNSFFIKHDRVITFQPIQTAIYNILTGIWTNYCLFDEKKKKRINK